MPRADNKFNRCACVPRVQLCAAVCVCVCCARVCAGCLQQTVALGRVAAADVVAGPFAAAGRN